MTNLEEIAWGRLVWDTNRLRKGTQRTFHASAQERAGTATVVTERAAAELAGLIDPHDIEGSLERAYAACAAPETIARSVVRFGIRNVPAYIRMNIWWAEEWLRPDSPYKVRTLNEEERNKANELLMHLAGSGVFKNRTAETIGNEADAVIICEAAALGRRYVMTENMKEAIGIGQWTLEIQDAGLIDQDAVVLYADTALRDWCIAHRGYACEAIATAFWPRNANASALEVEQQTRRMIDPIEGQSQTGGNKDAKKQPPLEGAKLVEVAAAARRELAQANDWPGWVERMRRTLPHKTRNADRRHPAHPENANRDWSKRTEDQAESEHLLRWRISAKEDRTVVEELGHDGKYRVAKVFPKGAEQAVGDFLVEQDIEVAGLPRHGGRKETSGGFCTALTNAIHEERARTRNADE